MTEDELSSLIERLDREVPKVGALVKLHQYGGGPDECQVVANRAGYLRLGIEFLKGAFASSINPKEPSGVRVDVDYLITGDSSVNFDWFERREDLPERSTAPPTPGRIAAAVAVTFFLLLLVLSAVGLVTVLRAIF
jgi:hypothetical protein